MPFFVNSQSKYVLINSYKVLTSTFSSMDSLRRLSRRKFSFLLPTFYLRGYHLFFIVRNPYDRVFSMFDYITKRSPKKISMHQDYHWRNCHEAIIGALGLAEESDDNQVKFFLSLDINTFVSILPTVFRSDGHFYPQIWSLRTLPFPFIRAKPTQILKMEDLEKLSKAMNLDFSIKKNISHLDYSNLSLSTDSISIIREIYRDDFVVCGYPLTFDSKPKL